MKSSIILSVLIGISTASTLFAQTIQPSPTPTRPRVIIVGQGSYTPSPSPTPQKTVVVTNNIPRTSSTPFPSMTPVPVAPLALTLPRQMSLGQLRSKITEAKRLMQTKPMPTALTDGFLMTDLVRVAFYDWGASQVDFAMLTKTVFLSKNMEIPTTSANGRNIIIKIVRANGVNTPVYVFDSNNQPQTPLMVQYPVERNGRYMETAYYISSHPAIVTSEVVNAGRLYVHNTIDIARLKLQEKGIYISPQIADIAERLATVEHVDHLRFRNEYHQNIYNDIFTLFALNEGNTYRYSVSSAGAGGMVQMIPSTYYMVRSRYYSVGLIPDFVEGMRNHVNAAQAMLLYMDMSWSDLAASEAVSNALASGTATQAQLMAAGYNSNPARLPIYLRRGGAGWRYLIPRETQIYLQIYSSLERAVPMTPRVK